MTQRAILRYDGEKFIPETPLDLKVNALYKVTFLKKLEDRVPPDLPENGD